MATRNFFVEISRATAAVNRRQCALAGVGMLHGGRAPAFIQRCVGVASRARSFGGNEYSQNEEDQNCDQHQIPSTESCSSSGGGRSQTPLNRAIFASAHPQFPLIRSGLHKSSCMAVIPASVYAHLLIKTYRITIWLQ